MLSAGFSAAELACTEMEEIMNMLDLAFHDSQGLLGFGKAACLIEYKDRNLTRVFQKLLICHRTLMTQLEAFSV